MTAQAEALLHPSTSGAPAEKPSSAYESLWVIIFPEFPCLIFTIRYDMYTGESKHPNASAGDAVDLGSYHEAEGHPEGAALQLIEMANGETIWCVTVPWDDHAHDPITDVSLGQ